TRSTRTGATVTHPPLRARACRIPPRRTVVARSIRPCAHGLAVATGAPATRGDPSAPARTGLPSQFHRCATDGPIRPCAHGLAEVYRLRVREREPSAPARTGLPLRNHSTNRLLMGWMCQASLRSAKPCVQGGGRRRPP